MNLEPLLNATQVAKMLGVHRTTLWKNIKKGQFPAPIEVCGCRRWRPSVVEAYIREREALASGRSGRIRGRGAAHSEVSP